MFCFLQFHSDPTITSPWIVVRLALLELRLVWKKWPRDWTLKTRGAISWYAGSSLEPGSNTLKNRLVGWRFCKDFAIFPHGNPNFLPVAEMSAFLIATSCVISTTCQTFAFRIWGGLDKTQDPRRGNKRWIIREKSRWFGYMGDIHWTSIYRQTLGIRNPRKGTAPQHFAVHLYTWQKIHVFLPKWSKYPLKPKQFF